MKTVNTKQDNDNALKAEGDSVETVVSLEQSKEIKWRREVIKGAEIYLDKFEGLNPCEAKAIVAYKRKLTEERFFLARLRGKPIDAKWAEDAFKDWSCADQAWRLVANTRFHGSRKR
jgi:hypothetical protein